MEIPFDCLGDHGPYGKDCRVFPTANNRRPAHDKLLVYGGHIGQIGAADSQINRPAVRSDRPRHGACFAPVGGDQDGHIGKSSHNRNVFHRLVSRAVSVIRKASARSDDLHVQIGQTYALPDLVESAAGREGGKRVRKRNLAGQRKTCSKRSHIRFGNSHFKIAVRKSLFKIAGHR
jgi:hypothetical protein